MDFPILWIVAQRRLEPFEGGTIVAAQKMNIAYLVVGSRIVRIDRQAALERCERIVVAAKLEQDIAEVEVREEIVLEVGDDAELLGRFGEQAVALIVKAECVVGLA